MEKSNLIIIELEVLAKLTKPELIKLYSVVLAKGISSGGETLISAKALMKELNISERTLRRRRNTLMKLKLLTVSKTDKEETWHIAVGFLTTLAKNTNSEVVVPQADNTEVVRIGHEVVQNGHVDVRNGQKLSETSEEKKAASEINTSASIDDSVSNVQDTASIVESVYKAPIDSKDSIDSIESGVVKRGMSLPTSAAKASERIHEFPYPGALQISAVWYWAIERYRKHNLDTELTAALFKKWAITYSRIFGRVLGNKWEAHKEYIDWYLNSQEKFVRDTCSYSFDFMASTSCYNKRLSDKTPKSRETFVHPGEDERIAKLMEKIRNA